VSSPIAVRPLGVISGAVSGVGGAVLLQQYGVQPMSPLLLLGSVFAGVLLGIVLPTVARATARPAPGAAPTAPAAAGWTPTHTVPLSGIWAWLTPDPAAQPTTSLVGGSTVQAIGQTGNWTQVRTPEGWVGWVDTRQLAPTAAASAPPPDDPTRGQP
jgi:hypothetical protein